MSDTNQKDLVLSINEYAYVLDETKGHVSCLVGPMKMSLSQSDRLVRFNSKTKEFEPCYYEDAKSLFVTAPENWYVILKNPAGENKHPVQWYYDCGFDRVYDRPIIIQDFYILSHTPRNVGAPIYGYIYGHIHNDEMYKDYTVNSFCACVERINYKPILFDKVIKKMKECQND